MILAADIGGTNARLGLFDASDRTLVHSATYPTAEVAGIDELLARFVPRSTTVSSSCIAVAGPVHRGRSRPVNLPWPVEQEVVSRVLRTRAVSVVNDLAANARGVPLLGEGDLLTLNVGEPDPHGARAVVSAGTGLGEAGLVRLGGGYVAIPGEGGHADFAPRSDLEVELYRFLAAQLGHVSYERVCSGMGLVNIYRFLAPFMPVPTPAQVTAEADRDPHSAAAHALRLFSSIYGARAANVALTFMATGGVYLGGGIAPRLADRLTDGTFMRAFTDKGRMSTLLRAVPVQIVLNDRAALLGAAELAAELL